MYFSSSNRLLLTNKSASWEFFPLLFFSVLRFQSLCVFNLGIQTRFPPKSIIFFFVCEKKLKMFLQLVASPCLLHHHEETLHLNSWHHFSIRPPPPPPHGLEIEPHKQETYILSVLRACLPDEWLHFFPSSPSSSESITSPSVGGRKHLERS